MMYHHLKLIIKVIKNCIMKKIDLPLVLFIVVCIFSFGIYTFLYYKDHESDINGIFKKDTISEATIEMFNKHNISIYADFINWCYRI